MVEIKVTCSDEVIKVGKVICLLRSYEAHAVEMESAVPTEPEFFLKPATSIIGHEDYIRIPKESEDVHHEVELAVVIGKPGKDIAECEAMEHVLGYAVFIDVTARDIQARAKKSGKPWSAAKGYDTFAPMSDITPKEKVSDGQNLGIWLKVNGEVRQMSNTSKMIFSIERMISHISGIMRLERGDVIATGTPEGVSQIVVGDDIEAGIEDVGTIKIGVR
jgi:2-keto-4-pentenoate hydratase/2-oxohepta-3-ene-1,7-dioic acid hydratase in catechol pathway